MKFVTDGDSTLNQNKKKHINTAGDSSILNSLKTEKQMKFMIDADSTIN